MKKDFYKVYGYISYLNYILWLLELNLLFFLVNLPIMGLFLFVKFQLTTAPLFFAAGVTVGPSLYAMFESLRDVEKNNGIIICYLKSLKANFLPCLKVTVILDFLMILILCELTMMDRLQIMEGFRWFLIFFMCILITFSVNLFIVFSTWKQTGKEAVILNAKLSIVKAGRYNLSLMICLGTFILLQYVPVYMILYGFALAGFLCYKNFVPIIHFVNERPENTNRETLN